MDGKPWYRSKTLWVNAIALAAIIINTVTGADVVDEAAAAAVITVVNLVLRLVTGRPLELAARR